jgi:hypothetical protein
MDLKNLAEMEAKAVETRFESKLHEKVAGALHRIGVIKAEELHAAQLVIADVVGRRVLMSNVVFVAALTGILGFVLGVIVK